MAGQWLGARARGTGDTTRPHCPMIVLKSPKDWTGPEVVDVPSPGAVTA
jgi:xylulose-5-phosphate/fructose-6-phosphate phosphoketolase